VEPNSQLDDDVRDALLALLDSVEREDEYLRLQQMRQFKKNNLFWHGFQYLFWSDIDQDWRIPTHQEMEEISGREETRYIFDYVVNHFKAHGEAIIAALSTDIPDVRFGPRNAQDPSDRRAVDAANNCIDLIEKWNRAKLLVINALFYLATEGFVASYTYNRKDVEYGTINIPKYDTREEMDTSQVSCPQCGYSEPVESTPPLAPTIAPDCPNCPGVQMQNPTQVVPFLVGETPIPKGREIVEVYGPLEVRLPSYVKKQADAGYLIHYVDGDPALFKGTFTDVADEIESDPGQTYERIMRQSSLSMDGYQLNIRLATLKRCWFRPWLMHKLDKAFDEVKAKVAEIFPHGIYFSVIGKTICEFRDESMDPHWTITKSGPSKGIHADPLLQSEVQLQEIRNNLVNMFVMQVEYGVASTYADTEVFDFEGQSKQEVAPGYIYPVTPRPGQSIGDAFYTERTSQLSKESTQLLQALDQDEQFVNGSFPSIWGGPAQGGSKTLGEYEKSRAFALQRLGLVYYFLNVWWAETGDKAVRSFIAHQVEDEPITTTTPGGDFQTRWIKKADLKGSFDRLEPEASSDFPVSFAQKRQLITNLLQLNNPEINQGLLSPENISVIKSYMGLPELVIPNEVQRRKQIREILILIGLEPQEGQAGPLSAVPIEPAIDNHAIHIDELTNFLCSDTGQDLKEYNPQGYANCLLHLIEHKKAMIPMILPPMGKPNGAPAPAKPPRLPEVQ